jgi:hypothetical protein
VRAGCRGQKINRACHPRAHQRNDELDALVEADLGESEAGEFFRQMLSDWQKLGYTDGFAEGKLVSAPAERLRPKAAFQRLGGEVDKTEERVASTRRASRWRSDKPKRPRKHCARTRRNQIGPKPLKTKETAKRLIQRPQSIQRLKAPHAKRFVSQGEMKLSRLNPKGEPRREAQRVAQKSALKPLKSLARVNLCAGRGGEVSQAAISPATIALARRN